MNRIKAILIEWRNRHDTCLRASHGTLAQINSTSSLRKANHEDLRRGSKPSRRLATRLTDFPGTMKVVLLDQHYLNRPRLRSRLAACFLGAALIGSSVQAAEYRFTPEPTYTPDAAELIYQPLLDYLSKATGETFVLTPATNYSSYWRDILKPDQTDFSYDEAQFADYRITRLNFIPLARRSQPTSYTLLANAEFDGKDPKALLSSRIATMPAPSLGYAVLMQIYSDPVQQPEIKSSATSWRDAIGILNSGESDAAIFPTWMLETYGNPALVSLYTSIELPGPAILASPKVPEDVRNKVRDALLNVEGAPELEELLLELGISKFVPSNAKDYEGDQKMLSGFYGYVRK